MLRAIGLVVLSSCLLSTACATRYEYVGGETAGDRALWECRQSVQTMTQPSTTVTVQGGAPPGQLNFGLQPGADAVARAITIRRLTDDCMRARGYEGR